MDLELRGKRAIVTGGTRGIGRAIAALLASEGCNVAICARDAAQVTATVEALSGAGVTALGPGPPPARPEFDRPVVGLDGLGPLLPPRPQRPLEPPEVAVLLFQLHRLATVGGGLLVLAVCHQFANLLLGIIPAGNANEEVSPARQIELGRDTAPMNGVKARAVA